LHLDRFAGCDDVRIARGFSRATVSGLAIADRFDMINGEPSDDLVFL
jgi:hypothetical protein